MTWQLGDVVPLSVTITDADGRPANAGAVNLTITLPDGTTTLVGPLAPTSVGVYDHDYPTVQAGRHGVRWVATGANASAFTDAFDVEPADDLDFVSLADVKEHMKKTGTVTNGTQLAGFVSAACQMIVDRIGRVAPATITDEHQTAGRRRTILLEEYPVIAVTSVVVAGSPPTAILQADPDTGVDGWELHDGGVLKHTASWPAGTIRVTYRAGRTPTPANVRLAGLELAAHLWRASQLNSGGGRPGLSGGDEMVVPGSAFALPYRVRELLGLGKLPTDGPLVG